MLAGCALAPRWIWEIIIPLQVFFKDLAEIIGYSTYLYILKKQNIHFKAILPVADSIYIKQEQMLNILKLQDLRVNKKNLKLIYIPVKNLRWSVLRN